MLVCHVLVNVMQVSEIWLRVINAEVCVVSIRLECNQTIRPWQEYDIQLLSTLWRLVPDENA